MRPFTDHACARFARVGLPRPWLLLTLVGALSLLARPSAAAALKGPPWISIEYPANPYDRGTRGALLTLHTYHHGVPSNASVTARAEGVIGGAHRSIELAVRATDRPGVWAVVGKLPEGGSWVISSIMTDPETHARASALLALRANGQVAALSVPMDRHGEWLVPREATAAEVDAMLRGAVALSAAPLGRARPPAAALAGVGLLGGLLPLLARRRRVRSH